jgi:hypothetical protein
MKECKVLGVKHKLPMTLINGVVVVDDFDINDYDWK